MSIHSIRLLFLAMILTTTMKRIDAFKYLTAHVTVHCRQQAHQISVVSEKTMIGPTSSISKIDHSTPILLVGSCFSEVIGTELKRYKFNVQTNPQGIVFNPITMANCLSNVVRRREFRKEDLVVDVNSEEILHSWNHHTSYSSKVGDESEMLREMNANIDSSHLLLRSCKFLFLTLGTSFVHVLNKTGEVVGNCHKREWPETCLG